MKHPYSQFFWRDWQSDSALRSCSIAARGMWMELLCIMAQSDDRGRLLVNGKAPAMPAIARMCCVEFAEAEALMGELRDNGVFSEVDGVVISRRMLRENERSEIYRGNVQKRWSKTGEEKKVITTTTTIPIPRDCMSVSNTNCNTNGTPVAENTIDLLATPPDRPARFTPEEVERRIGLLEPCLSVYHSTRSKFNDSERIQVVALFTREHYEREVETMLKWMKAKKSAGEAKFLPKLSSLLTEWDTYLSLAERWLADKAQGKKSDLPNTWHSPDGDKSLAEDMRKAGL